MLAEKKLFSLEFCGNDMDSIILFLKEEDRWFLLLNFGIPRWNRPAAAG